MWRADIRGDVFDGGCLASARWAGLLDTRDLAAIRPRDFGMIEAGERIPLTLDCIREQ